MAQAQVKQRSASKSASMEHAKIGQTMQCPNTDAASHSGTRDSARTMPSSRQLIQQRTSSAIQKQRVPQGFQSKTTAWLHAKVVPQEVELSSVISEEDENIMSTGGAIDEDGINQSVIYTSSIRSVKRRLDDASKGEIVTIHMANGSSLESSENDGGQDEEYKSPNQDPLKILDYIHVDDGTPITANFETFEEPRGKQEHITNPNTISESEEEQVIFYSEGLSNHATSYNPSALDTADKVNHLTVIGSQFENGSIYQSHTSARFPDYAQCGAAICCNDCAVSSHTEAHTVYAAKKSQPQRRQTLNAGGVSGGQNRLILTNTVLSNSTICEGDTGGQQNKKQVDDQQPRTRQRQQAESHDVCPHHHVKRTANDGTQWRPLADLVKLENRKAHQRFRSTEDTMLEKTPHFNSSNERIEEVQNRARNDSSGGTHQSPTHKLRIEQLRNRQNRPGAPRDNQNVNHEQSHPSERLISPPSDLNRINLTKSVEEEYSPKTFGTAENSPTLNKNSDLFPKDARMIYEFCQFLSLPDRHLSMPVSKESQKKQQLLDQSVQSYYNKSNDSTLSKNISTSQAPVSRYQQLFQYTVGTVANHQRYANSAQRDQLSPSTQTKQIVISDLTQSNQQAKFNTTLRLDHIFNSILERSSQSKQAKEVSLLRKLSMWALCLIIMTTKDKLRELPTELSKELIFFKEEIENDNPFDGKVQLNPIPEIVKCMLKKDPSVLVRMKQETFKLDSEKRIWTFPQFKPISGVVSITEALIAEQELQQTQQQLSPSFGLSKKTSLVDADPAKFAELFPDPQDYCIGISMQHGSPFRKSPRKANQLASLDQRIKQEIQNQSSQRSGSQSPRWMYAQQQKETKMIVFSGAYQSKTGSKLINSSRDTNSRQHTFDTLMEVPDEGLVDMKEFTDVDINQQNLDYQPKRGNSIDGPQDCDTFLTNADDSSKHAKPESRHSTPLTKINLARKKSAGKVRIPNYGLKTNVATNVKNNWQRSISTISKNHPNNAAKSVVIGSSSGKKTATTKLNYGYSSMAQSNDQNGSVEKRQKDDQTKSSLSAHRKAQTKTSQSALIGNKKKMPSQDKTLQKKQLIQRLALNQGRKTADTRASQEQKKVGTSLNVSQNKAQSQRGQKPSLLSAQIKSTGIVAHHARSFAMTTTGKPTPQVSFVKTATSVESQNRRRKDPQYLSVRDSNPVSPRSSINSNYKLTQTLPLSHRVKSGQSNSTVKESQQQQPIKAMMSQTTQKRQTGAQVNRTKTSLESHLMSRVMAPPTGQHTVHNSQDIKNGLRQALLLSGQQNRKTNEGIKISSTMQQSSLPSQVQTSHRTPRRRLPQSFQHQSTTSKQKLGKTERFKQTSKKSSRNSCTLPRELSLSKSAQKIQETLERRTEETKPEEKKHSSKSSNSSFIFADQDEFACVTQTMPSIKSHTLKKDQNLPQAKAKINLNAQLHSKLLLSNNRVSQTPGSKIGNYSSSNKHMLAVPYDHMRSTDFKAHTSRQSSTGKSKPTQAKSSRNTQTSIKGSFAKAATQAGSGSQRNHFSSVNQNLMMSSGTINSSATPTPAKKHNLRQLLQPSISRSTSKVSSSSTRQVRSNQTSTRQLTSQQSNKPHRTMTTTQTSSTQRMTEGKQKEVPQKQATVTKTFIQLF